MMCVPKRAASCFPQDFPGKVLGGATPGIHSGSWADSHAQLIVRVSVSRILQSSPCGHPYFPGVHRLSDLFSSLLWHQNWRYPENFEKEMNRSIGSAGAFFLRPTQLEPFSLQPSHITLDTCLVESPFQPSGLVNILDKWCTRRESALIQARRLSGLCNGSFYVSIHKVPRYLVICYSWVFLMSAQGVSGRD